MTTGNNGRSIADIFRDLLTQLTALLRNEREIAQAEINEKIDQLARGLAMIAIGAVLMIPALVVLLGAAVTAIVHAGLEPYWAALIVGGVALLVGLGLLSAGRGSLALKRLAPTRTLRGLRKDAAIATHHLRRT